MAKKRRDEVVPRPIKTTEYAMHFITAEAEKGWGDAEATARNHIAEAWDYLTKTPDLEDPEKCYGLGIGQQLGWLTNQLAPKNM